MKKTGKVEEIKFEKVNIIVYGLTNKHFLFDIKDLEYVFEGNLFDDEKIYEIFRQDEDEAANCYIEAILDYLRLYCLKNDCNIATVNTSATDRATSHLEIYQKRRCSAQIEFIKRLIDLKEDVKKEH